MHLYTVFYYNLYSHVFTLLQQLIPIQPGTFFLTQYIL